MTLLGEEFPRLRGLSRRLSSAGLSINSTLQDIPDQLRGELEELVAKHFSEESLHALEELAPGIQNLDDIALASSLRTGRLHSALSRVGFRTWGSLATWSVSRLAGIPGVGEASIQELLQSLARLLLSQELQISRRRWASVGADVEAVSFASETLQLLATWTAREYRDLATLEEMFQQIDRLPLPPDLERRLAQVKETPLLCLTDAQLATAPVEELTEELLQSLDDAERRVFELRVLALSPSTLQEVGEELGFTRERARQLQLSAEECISTLLISRRFLPLHWRASRLRATLGRCAPVEHPTLDLVLEENLCNVREESRYDVERLLLYIAGPYRHRHGWLELEEKEQISSLDLLELADEDGLLTIEEAASWLTEAGIASSFQDAWIMDFAKFRRQGNLLLRWTGSIADKSVAVLALRGAAADAETLVTEVGEGHSVRSAQNAFHRDKRLIKVNRTDWGLRKWNLEEYTSITEEIAQRISSAGGIAALGQITDEIVEQFGVRASSVRAYAEAPMFVVDEGRIRLRGDDEPYPISEDISSCKGVYKWGTDRLSVLVPVDTEILRGSGRSFAPQAAFVLGVRPDRPSSYSWSEGTLAITWPVTAALGPSLGSLRALAASVGASAGDSIRLDFDRLEASVQAELVSESLLASTSPREALRLLTGLPASEAPVKDLATALDLPTSTLRNCLFDRGDTLVVELLPPPASDPSLESALWELAKSLDDSRYGS